jgi:Ca2+:H+ antiporter
MEPLTRKDSSSQWLSEWPLLASVATAGLFLGFGDALLGDLSKPAWFVFILLWLFSATLLSSFAIVRHAECLAVKLGEPLGTLVLTLAVTGIEVMLIAATMAVGKGNPALARDAMFAVVMIVLNGMVGLTLLMGGLRYREQHHNLQGASAYLVMIVPLSVLGLVLPNFTLTTPGPIFSRAQGIFLSVMSIGIYAIFLAVQTSRHKHYFLPPSSPQEEEESGDPHEGLIVRSVPYHGLLLMCYLVPLVFLSKKLAVPVDYGVHVLRAPEALGGFIVAALVLSPESFSALRAALGNRLQRSVNLLLGSVLATIGLTIPAVLTIGLFTGRSIILGLGPAEMVLLSLTLMVSIMTFTSRRTNVLFGAVHLLLFLAYIMMVFDAA